MDSAAPGALAAGWTGEVGVDEVGDVGEDAAGERVGGRGESAERGLVGHDLVEAYDIIG